LWVGLQVPAQAGNQGFYIAGGLSVRGIDGTIDYANGTTFDIQAPYALPVEFTEDPTHVYILSRRANPSGYNLDSRNFYGFGFDIGYKFMRRFALSLSINYYMTKHGSQYLPWKTDPSGFHSDLSGAHTYEIDFYFYDWALVAEVDPFLIGLSLIIGHEASLHYKTITTQKEYYRDDSLFLRETEEISNLEGHPGWMAGIAYEHTLSGKWSVSTAATYSFYDFGSGPRIRMLLRFFPF
jgi:hypothetical protein